MSYCPRGHGEFQDWVARCPQCGAALTGEPPAPPSVSPARDDPLVKVATAPNQGEAEVLAAKLRAAGIGCMVKGAGSSSVWLGQGGWVPHYVYVLESDREAALEVLGEGASDNQ